MILLLLLLLFPALLFGESPRAVQEPMSSVLVCVNIEDTLCTDCDGDGTHNDPTYIQDTDGDGIPMWKEAVNVLDSIANVRGEEMCYVCSLEVKYWRNSGDYPQSLFISVMHPSYDTLGDYDTNTGVTGYLGGDTSRYVMRKLDRCMQAAYAQFGEYPKYGCNIGGPRWIRSNSGGTYATDPNTVPSYSSDGVIARDFTQFLESFYYYGVGSAWDTDIRITARWESRFHSAMIGSKAKRGFQPATWWNYKDAGVASDSVKLHMLWTTIAGITDDAAVELIRKAYQAEGGGWSADGTPNYFAVVDQRAEYSSRPEYFNLQSTIPFGGQYCEASNMFYDLREAFGLDNMYYDLYQNIITIRDTPDDTLFKIVGGYPDSSDVFHGYSGDPTLTGGDKAILYVSPMSYHNVSVGTIPTDICYQMTIDAAPGMGVVVPESWDAYTHGADTAFRTSTSDDQTLCMEWLDPNGLNATWGVGNVREVSVQVTAADYDSFVTAMYSPNCNLAVWSEALELSKCSNITYGWPLLYLRPAMVAEQESATFSGNCSEILSYAGTMPDVGSGPASPDSFNMYIEYLDGTTFDTTLNTSPGAQVTLSLGTRWKSKGVARATVSIVDSEGYYHSSEFISQ